jgi:hypothetical protein
MRRKELLRLIGTAICAEPLMLRCIKLLGIGQINAFALMVALGTCAASSAGKSSSHSSASIPVSVLQCIKRAVHRSRASAAGPRTP